MVKNQMNMAAKLSIKRVYETPSGEDGCRILIDRLWPRGLTKEKAQVDLWLKEISPSADLRKWFGHDPEKWPEFRKKYKAEINNNAEASQVLKNEIKKNEKVTLVYSAKDEEHNDAVVLLEVFGK